MKKDPPASAQDALRKLIASDKDLVITEVVSKGEYSETHWYADGEWEHICYCKQPI